MRRENNKLNVELETNKKYNEYYRETFEEIKKLCEKDPHSKQMIKIHLDYLEKIIKNEIETKYKFYNMI